MVTDGFGNTSVFRKSSIYVISKVIDRRKYYKVGLSTKSDISRMRDANTYLIPGNENHGYKVHSSYLFFMTNRRLSELSRITTKLIYIKYYYARTSNRTVSVS